jgi:cellulose synthase/poly-beta-1,6-N-acetylglucosamine synthase-like glycosyltransferase
MQIFKDIFSPPSINTVTMSFARYGERLPCVDIFICTADPQSEPPSLVISTILSLMAYDYPAEKLSVYLSDDGGSLLTFYAMWEASSFAKHWIPFCKRYNIEPRSPAAYFSESDGHQDLCTPKEWSLIKVRKYSKHTFLTPLIKWLLNRE